MKQARRHVGRYGKVRSHPDILPGVAARFKSDVCFTPLILTAECRSSRSSEPQRSLSLLETRLATWLPTDRELHDRFGWHERLQQRGIAVCAKGTRRTTPCFHLRLG